MAVAVRAAVSDPERAARPAERYLLFTVGEVEYAVDAATVRRFVDPGKVPAGTPPPAAPAARLIDLRQCFRVGEGPASRPMLIVESRRGSAVLLVDSVLGVARIEAAAVQELPPAFGGAERHWFHGLARLSDRVVVLIDVDGLLS